MGIRATDHSLSVERINATIGRNFIKQHHYSKGCHKSPTTYGCFNGDQLVGVVAYATPGSESVREYPFGPKYKDNVTELHRLVMLDAKDWDSDRPDHVLSWFVSRTLKMLPRDKPLIRGVMSYADTTEGHLGKIYRALNAIYYGQTGRTYAYWYDPVADKVMHPRQCGKNISKAEALELGWQPIRRGSKHRYFFLVGSAGEKRKYSKLLIQTPLSWKEDEVLVSCP